MNSFTFATETDDREGVSEGTNHPSGENELEHATKKSFKGRSNPTTSRTRLTSHSSLHSMCHSSSDRLLGARDGGSVTSRRTKSLQEEREEKERDPQKATVEGLMESNVSITCIPFILSIFFQNTASKSPLCFCNSPHLTLMDK